MCESGQDGRQDRVLQRGKLEKGTCLNGSMLRRKMRRRRELRRTSNKEQKALKKRLSAGCGEEE